VRSAAERTGSANLKRPKRRAAGSAPRCSDRTSGIVKGLIKCYDFRSQHVSFYVLQSASNLSIVAQYAREADCNLNNCRSSNQL
jgi:hypothetical protein